MLKVWSRFTANCRRRMTIDRVYANDTPSVRSRLDLRTLFSTDYINMTMEENNDSPLDIDVSSAVDQVVESASSLDEMSQDEVMACDISLTNIQGKARVGVNAPLAVGTEAADYINEHVEEVVNKEMSTDTGVKIGEMLISGDERIVGVQIKDEYKK